MTWIVTLLKQTLRSTSCIALCLLVPFSLFLLVDLAFLGMNYAAFQLYAGLWLFMIPFIAVAVVITALIAQLLNYFDARLWSIRAVVAIFNVAWGIWFSAGFIWLTDLHPAVFVPYIIVSAYVCARSVEGSPTLHKSCRAG